MNDGDTGQGTEDSLAMLESRFERLAGYCDALHDGVHRQSEHLTVPHTGMLLEHMLDTLDAIAGICRTLDEAAQEHQRKTSASGLLSLAFPDLHYGSDGVMVARHLISRARAGLLALEREEQEPGNG